MNIKISFQMFSRVYDTKYKPVHMISIKADYI